MQSLSVFSFLIPIGLLLLLFGLGLKYKEQITIWLFKKFNKKTDGYSFKKLKDRIVITHEKSNTDFYINLPTSEIMVKIVLSTLPFIIMFFIGFFIVRQVRDSIGQTMNVTGMNTTSTILSITPIIIIMVIVLLSMSIIKLFDRGI